MPTVALARDEIFERLGRTYTDAEFDELCFSFGIELDDVMTEEAARETRATGSGGAEATLSSSTTSGGRVLYYIAIPANRYDLLCLEGLTRALNIFLERIPPPVYRTLLPAASPIRMVVKPSTFPLRPFVVCAVLRGVRLTPSRYASLIDLQDKLHANICRKRTLVAIGTHDLATLTPPFTYAALPPESFSFVPLSDTRTFTGAALVEHYRTDPAVKHIKPYVDNIAASPTYPLITDANGTVLSLPPLINSAHSRITLATRDIFIEATATDLAKAHTVVNTLAAMFAEYTEPQAYAVEQVEVVYEAPVTTFVGVGKVAVSSQATPDLAPRAAAVSPSAVLSLVGAPSAALSTERAAQLLTRMGLQARVVRSGAGLEEAVAAAQASSMTATPLAGGGQEDPLIAVSVPPTRSDVLHECDIAEDVAIAFGYNDIPRTLPPTPTTGGQNPVNALTEHLRRELAAAGCDECLTLALCSREENYGAMLKPEDGRAVILSNPQSEEFQIGRTALVPGLLKSLHCNRSAKISEGLRLFEVSDVMLLDGSADVGARNERHVGLLYSGATAGLEVVHGLVDKIMQLLEIPVRPFAWCVAAAAAAGGEGGAAGEAAAAAAAKASYGKHGMRYAVVGRDSVPSYFPGRGAEIIIERVGGGEPVVVGHLGILHPSVLKNFELSFPTSVAEINIEMFV